MAGQPWLKPVLNARVFVLNCLEHTPHVGGLSTYPCASLPLKFTLPRPTTFAKLPSAQMAPPQHSAVLAVRMADFAISFEARGYGIKATKSEKRLISPCILSHP